MQQHTMPLFPLSTVVFPDGYLPLQIFEVRYLDLIKKCLRDKTPFGVVSILEGAEVRSPGEKMALAEIGTLVEITHADAPSPALLKIQTRGAQRFTLLGSHQEKNGLWMGEVELIANDTVVEIPDDLSAAANGLAEVIKNLEGQQVPTDQMPIQRPYRLDECGWVANRWCELLPIDKKVKLRMLGLESPLLRLELINDLLQNNRFV